MFVLLEALVPACRQAGRQAGRPCVVCFPRRAAQPPSLPLRPSVSHSSLVRFVSPALSLARAASIESLPNPQLRLLRIYFGPLF